MRYIITFCLLVLGFYGFSQSNQAEYLEAKRQFSLGNYAAAKLGFQSLAEDKTFERYASFYFALAAYKNGETKLAYDMWRQVSINYADWDQQLEVRYWLARSAFDLQNYSASFRYLNQLPDDLQALVMQQTIDGLSYEDLKNTYVLNPESKELGSILAMEIMQLPYSERDQQLLKELQEKFEIEIKGEEANLPDIKKEQYAIAVVLPFMFDSVENPQSVLRNTIIWDLYMGMNMAQKDLEKEGIRIELFPFDTKKREDLTGQLVQSGELDAADVLVGPLYSGPTDVISSFSLNEKKTMINPLSANGAIVGDNPFSYLFKPSYETQGRVAAQYAKRKFTKNKKAFIFYETDRDSLVARTYLEEIEQDSFFVIRFERMTNESAQQVQKDFTEKYEVRLDDQYTKVEMDSIALIPGRIVKNRPLRGERSGALIKDQEGNPITEYYEERFNVVEDSVGHIFVASSSNLLVNNFISLAEVRSDTIGIIGYDSWLNFSTISYNQLERLEIAFISPSLFQRESAVYADLEQNFISELGREPGQYHLIGYELTYQLGQLLETHGKYFQKGLHDLNGRIEGKIMYGLKYDQFHDNQVAPITRLRNLRLVIEE